MEQGLQTDNTITQNTGNVIENLNTVANNTDYVITRNNENEVVVTELENTIVNLQEVTAGNEFIITRNNANNVVVRETTERIEDLDTIIQDQEYILTRNNNNQIRPAPTQERIGNLINIGNGQNFFLSRDNLGSLIVRQNQNIELTNPTTGDLFYAIRRNNGNFTLQRTPALTEYTFFTNNLQNNATFDILGELGSRCVHVINTTGKIVKIGVLHVTTFRSVGLIDRDYSFEIIHNNINLPFFTVNTTPSNDRRSTTMDLEHLNIFVRQGDCIGIRYIVGNNGRTGDYCQVRLTIDANARDRSFNEELIS